jgi:hypothetical protein
MARKFSSDSSPNRLSGLFAFLGRLENEREKRNGQENRQEERSEQEGHRQEVDVLTEKIHGKENGPQQRKNQNQERPHRQEIRRR